MDSASSTTATKRAKKTGSPYHHGDLREALIRAGLNILREGGIAKLSLREAARAAGVSQAAPYRHFENKEALIAAITQEGFLLQTREIRESMAPYQGKPEEQFHRIAQTYLKMALTYPDHFKLMFAGIPPLSGLKYPDLARCANELVGEFVEVVRNCQRERILKAGDPTQIAMVAWSCIHGFTSLLLSRGIGYLSLTDDQAVLAMRAHSIAVLEGLRPPSTDQA